MGINAGAYNHHWDGSILIDLMDRTGITTRYFAEKSGISIASVINYRTNKTTPSVDVLVTIADFFNVPTDYLCGRYSEADAKAFINDYPKYYEQLRRKDYEDYLGKKSEYRNQADGWEAPYPYNLLDDISCGPYDHVPSDDELDGLNAMIATLNPKEQICLKEYYENGKTLGTIGDMLGVGAERIRQIIAKGLRKLRYPARFNTIKKGLRNSVAERDYFSKLKEVENRERILAYKEEVFNKKLEAYKDKIKIDVESFALVHAAQNDPDVLDTPIEELNLSVRVFKALKRSELNTIGDIIKSLREYKGTEGLIKVRNLGIKSVDEILDVCSKFLGFDVCSVYEKEERAAVVE